MSDKNSVRLMDVTDNCDNLRVPLSAAKRKLLKSKYPYYGAQGIIDYVDGYLFDGEYLLVAEDGENLRSRKENLCTLVEGKFWVNNHAHILKAKPNLNIKYLYYYLNAIDFSGLITGSAQPKLTKESLECIPIVIPNRPTQDRIACFLWNIDKKIKLNNQINSELEAMAKLIYDYWFVQFDFPDENGNPYKSSGGKMVYNKELKREIPFGWGAGRLSDFEQKIITGKTPSTENKNNFGGDIPFICIGDVRGNMYITKTEITLSEVGAASQANKFIPKDSICVTCIASPGLVGFATSESQTNQQLNAIVCSKKENRYFLYFYLKEYFKFSKAKMGNTFANMNKDDFSSILLPYPKDEIVDSFSKKVKSIFDLVLQNSNENDLLNEQRDWLLPMLMNGQVKVNRTNN